MKYIKINNKNSKLKILNLGLASLMLSGVVFTTPNFVNAMETTTAAVVEAKKEIDINDYDLIESYTTIVTDAKLEVYRTKAAGKVVNTAKNHTFFGATWPQLSGYREFKAEEKENWIFKGWRFEQKYKGQELGNRKDILNYYSFTNTHEHWTEEYKYIEGDTISVNRITGYGETFVNPMEYKIYADYNPTIIVSTSKEGEITNLTDKPEEIEYHGNKNYEIKAPEGYEIESVILNGKPIQNIKNVKTYTHKFKNVIEPQKLHANLVKVKNQEPPKAPIEPKEKENVKPNKPVVPKQEERDNNSWIRLDITHLSPTKLLPPQGKVDKKVENVEIHEAYMKGYPDGTIKPHGLVTRAEAAALVARLEKLSLTDTTKSMFKDVEDNAWYTPYINAVVNKNLLLADEDGNIRPNEPITRAEFVRMLAPIDKKNSTASIFADIKGHKFEAEINQEFGNKVIEGYEDGTFRPEGKITRAETTAMLNRKYDRVADADGMVMDYKAKIAKFTDLDESSWYYFEMIDATNTHKLTRRDTKDKYGRTNTIWKEIIKEDVK
ncbi:S-layer homology domain-containing protein [Peptoniphilus asaccharolyticus]